MSAAPKPSHNDDVRDDDSWDGDGPDDTNDRPLEEGSPADHGRDMVLKRVAQAAWRNTLTGVTVLHPDQASPTVLVGPAADVWHLSEVPIPEPDLMAEIASAYDLDVGDVTSELSPVIGQLCDMGLLLRLPATHTRGSSAE